MGVKAVYCVVDITISGGTLRASVVGNVVGGSHFDGDFNIDPQAANLNSELTASVQSFLTQSPYNLTFSAGDYVRLFPAIL